MIASIEGIVATVTETNAIVVVHGVGFRIALTKDALLGLVEGEAIHLRTHLAVREDALDLYGFLAESDLMMFEKLLTLPGIGPKSALSILSAASTETLEKAIVSQDAEYLTKVSGIGRKSAEKIVAGLKDKVTRQIHTDQEPRLKDEADTLEAIKSLGYSLQDARNALHEIPADIVGVSNRVKAALKYLGK